MPIQKGKPWQIVCDSADIAVECAQATAALGIECEPIVTTDDPGSKLIGLAKTGSVVGLCAADAPAPSVLARVATACGSNPCVMALVGRPDAPMASLGLARDLGIVAVDEVRPFASVLALLGGQARAPWTASLRGLAPLDRLRLSVAILPGSVSSGRLVRLSEGMLGWASDDGPPFPVGESRDVAQAIMAIRDREPAVGEDMAPPLDEAGSRAVQDVIFGPPRALSDPASKAALLPYGLPIPAEELCASPSRAAAEAARIGFPVRIALASPDLRVWDHPDLAVDGVDNAARVRDVYRQITTLALDRTRGARLLGVTVMANRAAHALLRVRASVLDDEFVLTEIGFADPHGRASGDHTHTAIRPSAVRIERVLGRLAGAPLLLDVPSSLRRKIVEDLSATIGRIAAFVLDHAKEIVSVEIDPLVVLVGGGVELREACVRVGDAFLRSLETGSNRPSPD